MKVLIEQEHSQGLMPIRFIGSLQEWRIVTVTQDEYAAFPLQASSSTVSLHHCGGDCSKEVEGFLSQWPS